MFEPISIGIFVGAMGVAAYGTYKMRAGAENDRTRDVETERADKDHERKMARLDWEQRQWLEGHNQEKYHMESEIEEMETKLNQEKKKRGISIGYKKY